PTATKTPTNSPTLTATKTPTNTRTNTPTTTATNSPSNTPTVTPTSTITNTPTITSTFTNFAFKNHSQRFCRNPIVNYSYNWFYLLRNRIKSDGVTMAHSIPPLIVTIVFCWKCFQSRVGRIT